MEIQNEFTVNVPIERVWAVLTDLEIVALCLPGAVLTGRESDTYVGKVKVKVGPVVSEYAGTAVLVEKDDEHHRAVIEAQGRNSGGAGGASARIVETLRPDGEKTVVSVITDLSITGKIAQFGKSAIAEVSEKLMGQFVQALESKLTAPTDPPEASASSTERPPDAPTSDSETRPVEAPELEAIDLMSVARGTIFKRFVPLIAVLVVVVVVIILIAR